MKILATDFFTNLIESITNFFTGKENNLSNLERIIISLVIIILAAFIIKILEKVLKRTFKIKKGPTVDKSAKSFLVSSIKILLWVLTTFVVLNVLNVDISSFAGIISAIMVALGLALQDLIASFASGIILLNQKNYNTGDYIDLSNDYGKVEGEILSINLFFTQLKTFDGQIVIIPNNNMLKANVTNYTKKETRRYAIEVKVDYDTNIDKVKEILFNIANNDNRVSKDNKPLVFVSEISDYSIKLYLKCWVYQKYYWDVYVEYNELVIKAFKENNINIPKSTTFNIEK